MLQAMFDKTAIPVLEQVVQFTQARHVVLAGNIANLDTPGYRVRDLSVEDFQSRLKEALAARDARRGYITHGDLAAGRSSPLAEVTRDPKTILYHDDSNVGIEHQVTEMVKNQMQHNLALAILTSQMRLLEAAISERV